MKKTRKPADVNRRAASIVADATGMTRQTENDELAKRRKKIAKKAAEARWAKARKAAREA